MVQTIQISPRGRGRSIYKCENIMHNIDQVYDNNSDVLVYYDSSKKNEQRQGGGLVWGVGKTDIPSNSSGGGSSSSNNNNSNNRYSHIILPKVLFPLFLAFCIVTTLSTIHTGFQLEDETIEYSRQQEPTEGSFPPGKSIRFATNNNPSRRRMDTFVSNRHLEHIESDEELLKGQLEQPKKSTVTARALHAKNENATPLRRSSSTLVRIEPLLREAKRDRHQRKLWEAEGESHGGAATLSNDSSIHHSGKKHPKKKKNISTKPTTSAPSSSTTTAVKAKKSNNNNNDIKYRRKKDKNNNIQLDFVIAGFPKSGTTSLLYSFGVHPETDIAPGERCAFANPFVPDNVAKAKLNQALTELYYKNTTNSSHINNNTLTDEMRRIHKIEDTTSSLHHSRSMSNATTRGLVVRRGIKCPNALQSFKTIARLEEHSPSAKFVVGLRHPIEMLQSFYNYRVTELYDKLRKKNEAATTTTNQTMTTTIASEKDSKTFDIPKLEDLIGMDNAWRGVSTDSVRYELYLMQFGKTSLSADMMKEYFVGRKHMAIKPNNFQIFLYTLDQLEDPDRNRNELFRKGLQNFLNLTQPIQPISHENLNHFVGKQAYEETIDICSTKFHRVRKIVLEQAKQTVQWINNEFVGTGGSRSRDVIVTNHNHFIESVQSWTTDPCLSKKK